MFYEPMSPVRHHPTQQVIITALKKIRNQQKDARLSSTCWRLSPNHGSLNETPQFCTQVLCCAPWRLRRPGHLPTGTKGALHSEASGPRPTPTHCCITSPHWGMLPLGLPPPTSVPLAHSPVCAALITHVGRHLDLGVGGVGLGSQAAFSLSGRK